MTWLAVDRAELGAERILDAAAQLFIDRGVGEPGMQDIARAAGCSRATVYRYFDNKESLLRAFVHREARDVVAQVLRGVAEGPDRQEAMVNAVLATLAEVRSRPHLRPWYSGDASVLHEVLRDSPVIPALMGAFAPRAGSEPDPDLGQLILRVVMSFLREPGATEAEEQRLLRRFLVAFVQPTRIRDSDPGRRVRARPGSPRETR